MNLDERLQEILANVDGAIACSLCGLDGVGVASVNKDPSFQVTAAEVEFATMLRTAEKASKNLEAGEVEELLLITEKLMMVVKRISADYYLSLALSPDGNLGRARFEIKRSIPKLAAELSL